MKTIRLIVATCCVALLMASCGENSTAYKKLQAQYDSLQIISQKSDQHLEEMLSLINEVENNFAEIRESENYVSLKNKGGDLSPSTQEEIRANMQVIANTLKKNREQIAKLNEELKNNTIKSKALAARIARITQELQNKETELAQLRQQLSMKDIRINELDSLNANLTQNVQDLAQTAHQQEEKIKEQESALYTAYYCFGSVSELKEQNILAGGGLFSSLKVLPEGFNKDYFLPIDTREVSTISLFAKKARVRTNHPTSSYKFIDDSEGNKVLQILNKKEFWGNGKYLVIEVTPN